MRHASLSTAQVFDSSDMESMTREERRFAEEQLRNIFSHEMSKVSMAIDKKRQVSSNLLHLEHLHEAQLQRTFDRLNQRMTNVDGKRKEQLKKRIETCRSHDEQWRTKMTQIDKKMRQENRAAEQKVVKYRAEQDEYLQRRQTQASKLHPRRNSVSDHNKSEEQDHYHRYSTQTFQRSPAKLSHQGKIPPLSVRAPIASLKSSSRNLLDEDIRTHRLKSHRLQQNKEQEIFQKALVKLDTITQRRKKMISLQESERKSLQESQTQRKIHDKSAMDLHERTSAERRVNLNSSTHVLGGNLSRRPVRRLFDHIAVKRQRQLKEVIERVMQFMERGEILQRSAQRNKKDYILRQIRQKVTEYKMIAQRS